MRATRSYAPGPGTSDHSTPPPESFSPPYATRLSVAGVARSARRTAIEDRTPALPGQPVAYLEPHVEAGFKPARARDKTEPAPAEAREACEPASDQGEPVPLHGYLKDAEAVQDDQGGR